MDIGHQHGDAHLQAKGNKHHEEFHGIAVPGTHVQEHAEACDPKHQSGGGE